MKQVLCRVGENLFGIDIAKVQGIEKMLDIVPVPNTSPLIRGIANLRGSVVPIISLHAKLNAEEIGNTAETTYIVTRIGELFVGFLVDAVAEIVELEEQAVIDVPVIVQNEDTSYIQSIINVKNQLVLVLDVDGILDEAEREKISKMVEDTEK